MPQHPPTGWQSVTSSNVDAVRYVWSNRWLDVRFLRGGRIWRYVDVPESVYWDMIDSPSKGRFVHYRLKGKYNEFEI